MRRRLLYLLLVFALTAALPTGAFAWEGRMSGMGDPYGLVSDESDFLTLPTKIVDGTGIKYYFDARFMYHDISDLDWSAKLDGPVSILGNPLGIGLHGGGSWSTSGELWDYSTQLGATVPFGAGRLGVFFKYTGQSGDFDGKQQLFGRVTGLGSASIRSAYDLDSSLDNFNLRLTYGQALEGDFRIAGEMQIIYQQEENRYHNSLQNITLADTAGNSLSIPGLGLELENDFIGELFPFMKPYDDDYLEILLKTGVEGRVGPLWVGMDVRGGTIFAGDNTWNQRARGTLDIFGTTLSATEGYRLKGGVDGWKLGGDIWARYPVSNTLSIPFTIRVDYSDKSRDGSGDGFINFSDGSSTLGISGFDWDYENEEKRFNIEVGAGVEKQLSPDLKIAGGLYYNYVYNKDTLSLGLDTGLNLLGSPVEVIWDNAKFPSLSEHLVKAKFLGEKQMSSCVLRASLSVFGGSVSEDYDSALTTPILGGLNVVKNRGSLDGTTWGLVGSFGATTKVRDFVLEPFIQAGYQEYSLDGPGSSSVLGSVVHAPWDLSRSFDQALIGAGISITY